MCLAHVKNIAKCGEKRFSSDNKKEKNQLPANKANQYGCNILFLKVFDFITKN